MDLKNGQNGFSYTYSAREQQQIKKIREKYEPSKPEEDKMERVLRLDRRVTQRAQCVSLIFGIIGALVFGLAMSLILSPFGDSMGVLDIVLGILLGIMGAVLASFAYPSYNYVTKREREKVAPEILKLTDELIK